MKSIIKNCLTFDSNLRIPIIKAVDLIAKINDIKEFKRKNKFSTSKYLINPIVYPNYFLYFQSVIEPLLDLINSSFFSSSSSSFFQNSQDPKLDESLFKLDFNINDQDKQKSISRNSSFEKINNDNLSNKNSYHRYNSICIDKISSYLTSLGNNPLKFEKETQTSLHKNSTDHATDLNIIVASKHPENVLLSEPPHLQLNQFIIDITNLFGFEPKMDNDKASEIIKERLSVDNKKITLFNIFNYIKEIYQQTQELKKDKETISKKNLDMMTTSFRQANTILKLLEETPKERDDEVNNNHDIQTQPTELYNSIMNKLNDLKASPMIRKTLSNIFYIDTRVLDLSEENEELKAFQEIIKMNSLFQNLIINQYDFVRQVYEGTTKSLKKEVLTEIFQKISQLGGFIKLILGNFNKIIFP